MARIEDGIFTQAYTTVGTDIEATYKLWDATHKLGVEEAKIFGKKLIKGPGETNFTMQETTSIPESEVGDYEVISHPNRVGVGMKIYTNQVGGTAGSNVTFRLLNGDDIQLKVYAGTWLPIATVGCDKAGLTIVA